MTAHGVQVRAVILDWAGTTVDFGSLAPVRTLQRVFERAAMQISEEQARRDMGLPKRDHIASILRALNVTGRWKEAHGREAGDADIDWLYELFVPMQLSCLAEYSDLIPGVKEAVDEIRSRGIKIGSTTGYTRAMLDVLIEKAAPQGYTADASVTPEEVGSGRPRPFMIFENARRLDVYPPAAIVKVGDTPSDVQEGLNAGACSVGVACTGNMMGLSKIDFESLPQGEKIDRAEKARAALQAAGAHYVIDSVTEIPAVLAHIAGRKKNATRL